MEHCNIKGIPNCQNFNEQGFCYDCGAKEPHKLNGTWPHNTWFQRRRKEVALNELSSMSKVSK